MTSVKIKNRKSEKRNLFSEITKWTCNERKTIYYIIRKEIPTL